VLSNLDKLKWGGTKLNYMVDEHLYLSVSMPPHY